MAPAHGGRFHFRRLVCKFRRETDDEYGFYSNVNPDVPHKRWIQGHERQLGEFFKRKTLPFNGYAEQVAPLYSSLDLRRNF